MPEKKSTNKQQYGAKGLLELFIFAAALATGTASSILSKVMYAATDADGQHFDKPLAQTMLMFFAMLIGLPIHYLIAIWKIPFPGYPGWAEDEEIDTTKSNQQKPSKESEDYERTPKMQSHKNKFSQATKAANERQSLLPTHQDSDYVDVEETRVPMATYFHLFIPAFFDSTSTATFMAGLLFLDVSVYQLLRGSGIIFVALLRQYGLKEHLFQYQWVGLWWNVVSALLVGATALLDSNNTETHPNASLQTTVLGVALMMVGTMLQAMEFVLEEKFMVADEVKVPPLLFFGMKGFWGSLLTLFFLYPIAYFIPGNDQGSFETIGGAIEMVRTTPYIQLLAVIYCFVIFGFNLFCVLVTFLLSSVWHAILDNFRPLTVWGTDLFIYYFLSSSGGNRLGEAWTRYSWLQLAGMAVLVYGTAIYNAPDSGSIRLQGQWWGLGLDFCKEYEEIESQREAQEHFALGSYPSLQSFLTVSAGASLNYSIRFGRRAHTLEAHKSPKVHASTANNYSTIAIDHSQHSI